MSPKYATVDIGQNGQWKTVWVSRREWQSIAFTDWIMLDDRGDLLPAFYQTYTPSECTAMLAVAAKRQIPVVTENVIDTREVK